MKKYNKMNFHANLETSSKNNGGEYRIRTGDLLHAMQALYQLS